MARACGREGLFEHASLRRATHVTAVPRMQTSRTVGVWWLRLTLRPQEVAPKISGDKIVLMQSINFGSNNAVLKEDSFGVLNQVAHILNSHPELSHVLVEGHCSNAGDTPEIEAFEMKLSLDRANAVKTYLVRQGVDESRLGTVGHGDKRPIATNDTAEGRARNRRVEFTIISNDA